MQNQIKLLSIKILPLVKITKVIKYISCSFCFLGTFILLSQVSTAFEEILPKGTSKTCTIVKVDDGDTFDIHCHMSENINKTIRNVRLIGVNTPDLGYNNHKHCYYENAKKVIDTLKNIQRKLTITFYGPDLCKDPYKGCRNLVRLTDKVTKKDINHLLIRQGYGFKWIHFSHIPKKLKIQYSIAEIKAKHEQKGLWGTCKVTQSTHKSKINSGIAPMMTN